MRGGITADGAWLAGLTRGAGAELEHDGRRNIARTGCQRFARHWHDVTRLDAAGFADAAIADKALAQAVADHKSAFFAEKDDGLFLDDAESFDALL